MDTLRRVAKVYHIWWFEAETFSWSCIQPILRECNLIRCDIGKRCFLWEVLTNQAIGVFICPTFPTMVRLGEETTTTKLCGDLFVAGELLAVVERDRLDNRVVEQTQYLIGNLVGKFRLRIADQHASANPLKECHQVARSISSTHQIGFPITESLAGFDHSRPQVDIHAIADFAA